MSEWISCDSCVAQAKHMFKGISGALYFCGHHANKFNEGLSAWAFESVSLEETEELISVD